MKIGLAILCRLSSSRLPGKHLLEIHGRTVLGHIIDRVKKGARGYPVVVATSSDQSDDPLVEYCKRSNLEYFRGELDNVAVRFLSCAENNGWDFMVRINGDNLFADPDTIRSMLAIAETNEYDFITNKPGQAFPYGVTVEIVRTAFYREILKEFTSPEHHEHVTLWLYENEDVGRRYIYENKTCPEAGGMQLSLDTEDDHHRYEKIFARMNKAPALYSLPEIYKLATSDPPYNPWQGKYGPLLIAEIGGNHEGDFEIAKDLAQKAISTGVDYVKFQVLRGDTLVSPVESPDRNSHFKRFELTLEQHMELAEMCKRGGVGYLASVWDLDMLDGVDPYLSAYKIGSGDLTAWPIIKEFARRGKPIILSTGLATQDEILQTVSQIQSVDRRYKNPEWLCLLQCTAMYPIADEDANLRVMETLRESTGLAVGYSDHTEGGMALRTAAAMGAEALEFHFTASREGKAFRDHKVSLTPDEVAQLQEDVQKIKSLRGTNVKEPQQTEIEQGHVVSFRRSVYTRKHVKAGDKINPDDLILLRPNHGIDPRDFEYVTKAKVHNNLEPYKGFSWNDLEICEER